MSNSQILSGLGLSTGKKARLYRILYQHGLRNGTALFLPYDQGLEHGPRDFFANPDAGDPRYILRLARQGTFNGIAIQIGLAEKFYWDFAGEVPLILKLNGKTDIPSDAEALSPLHATVADAVRLGADAVGYTLYVGSPAQDADFRQYRQVREEAQRLGMPLIVWAYPRGSAIEAKGGKDSFYAVDYAARVASELGADVVKVNFPHPEKRAAVKQQYDAGFTLYVGTPAQTADLENFRQVREDASRFGLPLIVWAYPRGAAIEAKGGRDSFYAVDYAARAAAELGADLVKVNFPHPEKRSGVPTAYDQEFTPERAIASVVRSAGRTMVLVSGGTRADDETMLEKAQDSMEAGATGLIFGRNIWQRDHDDALRLIGRLRDILAKYPA